MIEQLKNKYSVIDLCAIMKINRSSYYKWLKNRNKKNRYETDRELLTTLILEVHKKHKVYGYHAIASKIREETGWIISDNLVHKCCKVAGIHAEVRHYKYRKPGVESIVCPNIVRGRWNAARPLEIVASDMTCIKYKGVQYEWTYLLDTFNNEIISSHASSRPADRRPYFACLEDLKEKIKEQKEPVVLHTDQGSVYSSRAFADAHKDYNIIHSMSRAGTPTDNAVIEALNGWIKSEIRLDFMNEMYSNINEFLEHYVNYFNCERPAYALGYKSPVQYRIEQGFV